MVILVDARNGIVEQTRRHTIIASLLKMPFVVVAINKMDLVEFSQDIYNNIVIEYASVAKSLGLKNIHFIPISALNGDNIVDKSVSMPWYEGLSLLEFLETISIDSETNLTHARMPVQYVIRPQTEELPDYRGYAGKIISGIYRKGDEILVLPAGLSSRLSRIERNRQDVDEAVAGQAVILHLEDDIYIRGGGGGVKKDEQPLLGQELEVLLCWMDSKPLKPGNKYLLQHNSRRVRSVVKEIEYRLDVNSLEKVEGIETVGLNEIVRAKIKTASPIAYDLYKDLRVNGGLILIDETSNVTVGACMIQQ
jgi:sulfate adenylyltransferase subunit 1